VQHYGREGEPAAEAPNQLNLGGGAIGTSYPTHSKYSHISCHQRRALWLPIQEQYGLLGFGIGPSGQIPGAANVAHARPQHWVGSGLFGACDVQFCLTGAARSVLPLLSMPTWKQRPSLSCRFTGTLPSIST
jgi:hypothetical protein